MSASGTINKDRFELPVGLLADFLFPPGNGELTATCSRAAIEAEAFLHRGFGKESVQFFLSIPAEPPKIDGGVFSAGKGSGQFLRPEGAPSRLDLW